jgi:hypothetical protein
MMKNYKYYLWLTCLFHVTSPVFSGDHTTLLPETTVAFVCADNWNDAVQIWDGGQFISLTEEERRFQNQDFTDQFGVSPEVFSKMVSGSVTRAMIGQNPSDDGTTVIIADIDAGKFEEWKTAVPLKQEKENLFSLTFSGFGNQNKKAYYLRHEKILFLSQRAEPLEKIASLIVSKTQKSLADTEDYQTVLKRYITRIDNHTETVQFHWWLRPQFDFVQKELNKIDPKAGNVAERHGLDNISSL